MKTPNPLGEGHFRQLIFLCFQVLNGLEVMGYKVVSCGDYMTGEKRHDQKEFVWTMYKNKEEWENSTK